MPVDGVTCVCRAGYVPCGPAHWKPTFSRPPMRAHILYGFATKQERDDKQHEEYREEDFGETGGHACETGEAKERCDQRHDQECNCPTQHKPTLTFFLPGLWFFAAVPR